MPRITDKYAEGAILSVLNNESKITKIPCLCIYIKLDPTNAIMVKVKFASSFRTPMLALGLYMPEEMLTDTPAPEASPPISPVTNA